VSDQYPYGPQQPDQAQWGAQQQPQYPVQGQPPYTQQPQYPVQGEQPPYAQQSQYPVQGQQPPYAQQPTQPQWAARPRPGQPGYRLPPGPPPEKKGKAGKVAGFGCLGVLALVVFVAMSSGDDDKAKDTTAVAEAPKDAPAGAAKPADDKPADKKAAAPAKKPEAAKKVTFKVWGDAPGGALGPMDITYGSDTENLQGHGLPFTKSLPLDDGAMYYNVNAQLQGGGDIHCSVTVDGKTKKGHAQGGYNICNAQLSGGFSGGWN
jgi:hypothetical protein